MLPSLKAVRGAATGALALALLAGGIAFGVWARGLGEPGRIARAVKPMCDAALARAREAGLEAALAEERKARQANEQISAQLGIEIAQLRQTQKEAFDATAGHDRECIPAGARWLQRK